MMGWFKKIFKRSVREADTYAFMAESPWLRNDFIGEKKNMEFDIEEYNYTYFYCATSDETRDFIHTLIREANLRQQALYFYGYELCDYPAGYYFYHYVNDGIQLELAKTIYNYNARNALKWSDFMKDKKFTKADLKNGDVVKLRNGNVVIYIENLKGFIAKDHVYIDDAFTVDLKNIASADRGVDSYDIMQVRRPNSIGDCCFYAFRDDCQFGTLVYDRERDDPEIEEMTMEDVCKALGKRVKIVDSKALHCALMPLSQRKS
jgi:hypothetical protein